MRRVLWKPTRDGVAAVIRTEAASAYKARKFLEPLSPAQQAAFIEALEILAANLKASPVFADVVIERRVVENA
jgi:hypothetical protein